MEHAEDADNLSQPTLLLPAWLQWDRSYNRRTSNQIMFFLQHYLLRTRILCWDNCNFFEKNMMTYHENTDDVWWKYIRHTHMTYTWHMTHDEKDCGHGKTAFSGACYKIHSKQSNSTAIPNLEIKHGNILSLYNWSPFLLDASLGSFTIADILHLQAGELPWTFFLTTSLLEQASILYLFLQQW